MFAPESVCVPAPTLVTPCVTAGPQTLLLIAPENTPEAPVDPTVSVAEPVLPVPLVQYTLPLPFNAPMVILKGVPPLE